MRLEAGLVWKPEHGARSWGRRSSRTGWGVGTVKVSGARRRGRVRTGRGPGHAALGSVPAGWLWSFPYVRPRSAPLSSAYRSSDCLCCYLQALLPSTSASPTAEEGAAREAGSVCLLCTGWMGWLAGASPWTPLNLTQHLVVVCFSSYPLWACVSRTRSRIDCVDIIMFIYV